MSVLDEINVKLEFLRLLSAPERFVDPSRYCPLCKRSRASYVETVTRSALVCECGYVELSDRAPRV